MHIDLNGQVACVTGSATGIGRAIGEALAASGARVAFNHFGQAQQAETILAGVRQRGGTALAFDADVTDATAVAGMMDAIDAAFGPVEILVNNAGILLQKPFMEIAPEEWDRVLNVDLKSVFLCSQAALRRMLPRGAGCIINVASELAYLGREEFTAYCAAKAGVVGLTKSLAREFAPAIRINGIAPGPTDTAMLSLDAITPEWQARELAIPAARAAQPAEIAATAVFLASAHANFYQGQMLSPNGGALML